MKKFSILLIAALAIVACTKKFQDIPQPQKLIHKTFTVSAPVNPDGIDTASKTELAADGLTVNWSADDEINVIGITADGTVGQHPFTIKSGAGNASATFEGEVGEEEVTFYAVYPNVAIRADKLKASTPTFDFDKTLGATQTAVVNGFDPNFAPMTAVADADGNFQFRHGAAFFKLTIANDHVTSVKFTTSNTRFQGRPELDVATGGYVQIGSAQSDITLAPSDEHLVNGATYYIPVLCKASNLGSLSLTYSFSDGTTDQTITTSKMNNRRLELGKVYDLGAPFIFIKPEITADDISLDADATSGSITFTVGNPVTGGVMTAALKGTSDWLTVGSVSGSSVALTSTANTSTASRSAVVTLTYTYNTNQTVTKDVTVSQKAPGVTESHEYVFYVNGSGSPVQTKDGATGSYFTHSTSYQNFAGSDYNIETWTIGGYTSTRALKLNSAGYLTFKTSATLKTTLRFYYIRRKISDTGGKVRVVVGDNTSTTNFWTGDTPWDSYADSGVITLDKNTMYTIKQSSKEQSLLLAIVNESEESE